jgi:nitroreductase
MNLEEVIKNRRSIRTYKPKKVEEEKIKKLLSLINLAPSAHNLQSYKIFVIKNQEKIKQIADVTPGLGYFSSLPPLLLIFCALKRNSPSEEFYAIQDATIACSYAQLVACDLGLGSCWVGAFEGKEIKKILKTDLTPVAILPVGYPAENPQPKPRKKIEEIAEVIE